VRSRATAWVSFPTIQGLIVHASAHTTMLYVHVSEERVRAAVNNLKIAPTGRPEEPEVVEFRE